MLQWKTTCDIKQHLNNETLTYHERVEKIAEEICQCRAFDGTLFAAYLREILELDEHELQQEANGFLNDIYDYADEHRIWMGL